MCTSIILFIIILFLFLFIFNYLFFSKIHKKIEARFIAVNFELSNLNYKLESLNVMKQEKEEEVQGKTTF
jgi:hypothetical protein